MEGKIETRVGRVISSKMNKTVIVAVETPRRHPLYKKVVKKVGRFKAHCEKNDCNVGDTVRIVMTRPLSREKSWRVAEIVTKGEAVEAIKE